MDFGIYPPEINSGRMYTGPGPGPMLAAVQAWAGLADELYRTLSGYQLEVSELTDGVWSGPSSVAMGAAAQTYTQWLSATATQAEETAAQARAAAAAYEAAFVATVPPAEVAANRSLLAVLVATNFLGQNTPAIAATEALYAEMWVQDSLAMYNYAGASAAATVLTPFASPHQNTDPGATAGQAAAVGELGAVAESVQDVISVVPQTLSAMAAPLTPAEQFDLLVSLLAIFVVAPIDISTIFAIIPADVLTIVDFPIATFASYSGIEDDHDFSAWNGVEPWPGTDPAPVKPFVAPLPNLPPGGLPAPMLSAAFGRANMIGGLRVPPSWTQSADAAAEVRPVALTTPLASASAAAEVDLANAMNQLGIGAMAGQAMAGPPANAGSQTYGRVARVTGGAEEEPDEDVEVLPAPRTVMTGVAAAIRDIAAQRAAGLLSEQEYIEQKKSLLEISFGQ